MSRRIDEILAAGEGTAYNHAVLLENARTACEHALHEYDEGSLHLTTVEVDALRVVAAIERVGS